MWRVRVFRTRVRGWLTWKRSFAIVFVLLFLGVVFFFLCQPLNYFYTATPVEAKYTVYPSQTFINFAYASLGGPSGAVDITAQYKALIDLKASGSLSANNPINVNITIETFSVANNTYNQPPLYLSDASLTKYFSCLYLTNAIFDKNGTPALIQPLTKGPILIYASGIGNVSYGHYYEFLATVRFIASGDIEMSLLNSVQVSNYFTYYQNQPTTNLQKQPIVLASIQPVSDTLSIQFNQYILKLTAILGSFSILLIEPVIIDIVEPKDH